MVREANGQNKLRFSQVFWTLILVVTLSHNFSKCGNILQLYEDLLKTWSFSFTIRFCIYFCPSLFSAVLFGGYSTLGFSFEVEVTDIYFSYRSSWHPFVIISFFFSIIAVVHLFSQAGDFPGCGDFPSVFRCQRSSFFSFPEQQASRFQRTFLNCSKEQFHFFCSIFFFSLIPNRYTNQPTSRVQFLCACRWHRKPIANFLPLSVFNKYCNYSNKMFLNLQ